MLANIGSTSRVFWDTHVRHGVAFQQSHFVDNDTTTNQYEVVHELPFGIHVSHFNIFNWVTPPPPPGGKCDNSHVTVGKIWQNYRIIKGLIVNKIPM